MTSRDRRRREPVEHALQVGQLRRPALPDTVPDTVGGSKATRGPDAFAPSASARAISDSAASELGSVKLASLHTGCRNVLGLFG